MTTYKYTSNMNKIASEFLKLIPKIGSRRVEVDAIPGRVYMILKDFIDDSEDFCSNIRVLNLDIVAQRQGAFGAVGDMVAVEDDRRNVITISTVKTTNRGGFDREYINVIAKYGFNQIPISQEMQAVGAGGVMIIGVEAIRPRRTQPIIIRMYPDIIEAIAGGFLTSLVENGLTIHMPRYFSTFFCTESLRNTSLSVPGIYHSYSLLEKASFNLIQLYAPDGNPPLPIGNPAITYDRSFIQNILVQFFYNTFITKKYFGLTNFDCHLGNTMISYCRNDILRRWFNRDPYQVEEHYNGKNLSTVRAIYYKLPVRQKSINDLNTYDEVLIKIDNLGVILKQIDFGIISMIPQIVWNEDFSSYENADVILRSVHFNQRFDNGIGYDTVMNDMSAFSTQEINFFTRNLFLVLKHIDPGRAVDVGTMFNDLFRDLFPGSNIDSHENNNAFDRGVYRNYDCGTRTPAGGNPILIHHPLEALANYLRLYGHHQVTADNKLIVSPTPILPADENLDIFIMHEEINEAGFFPEPSNFFKTFKNVYNQCNREITRELEGGSPDKPSCDCLDDPENCEALETKDPSVTYSTSRSVYDFNVKFTEDDIWDDALGVFKRDINLGDISQDYVSVNSRLFQIYSFNLNPENIRNNDEKRIINTQDSEEYRYKDYQKLFNFMSIAPPIVDTVIKNVFFSILLLKRSDLVKRIKVSFSAEPRTLLRTFKSAPNTLLSINGGYFIVQSNMIDPLTHCFVPTLTRPYEIKEPFAPIGYTTVAPNEHVTKLNFPKAYNTHLAVILTNGTGIRIERYRDFLTRHNTVKVPRLYKNLDSPGRYFISCEDQIQEPATLRTGHPLDYTQAITSGPILIWDGNVVFTQDTVNNSRFVTDATFRFPGDPDCDTEADLVTAYRGTTINVGQIDARVPNGTRYAAVNSAVGNKLYSYSGHQHRDYNTMYGQRHSDVYMVHNVLAIDNVGNVLVFFVEGRGYDAPGLTRPQLAHMISNFRIRYAVSLDGGFSANCVFRNSKAKPVYLKNDPEKRQVGTSISFLLPN
jgi:hypothetical protein